MTYCPEQINWEHSAAALERLAADQRRWREIDATNLQKAREIKAANRKEKLENQQKARELRAKKAAWALAYYHLNRDRINDARAYPLDHWFRKAVARGKKETVQLRDGFFQVIRRLDKQLGNRTHIRIKRVLRRRLQKALASGSEFSKTARELLGCEIPHLKRHLESLWNAGMTWENYGFYGWHIDHILPCAKFNLQDPAEQKKCFHFSNLQPLWAKDNFNKRDS